jgi:hypothetical protein
MRNTTRKTAAEVEELDEAGDVPEEGGAPGIPQVQDPNAPALKVTLPADMIVGSAKDPASEDAPPPKRFLVVGGPYSIAYNSMVYKLFHGREVNENTHPINLLRMQGVRLDPLP